eukprot:m.12764 g.12764  ORF g.12764 m.12764 type:complete len:67 (+) comp4057_c0_seq1:1146-1346(+)
MSASASDPGSCLFTFEFALANGVDDSSEVVLAVFRSSSIVTYSYLPTTLFLSATTKTNFLLLCQQL